MYIYDNIDTGCREFYSHGHLVIYFTEEQIDNLINNGYYFGAHDPVREMFQKQCKSYGLFSEGQSWGSESDKPIDPLATQLWEN